MDQAAQLKARTKRFALDILRLLPTLPPAEPGFTIRTQITKSATSMGANYRSACRARSHREFTAKIGIVVEESDETLFWLELIRDGRLSTTSALHDLLREADELCAIFSAMHGTARRRERTGRG